MNTKLQLVRRIVGVIRRFPWSAGNLVVRILNAGVVGVVAYLILRSPAKAGVPSGEHSSPAAPLSELDPYALNRVVLMILLVLGVIAAWSHGQRILAVCMNVLADAVLESRRSSRDLSTSVDHLLAAVRQFFGFGDEAKPLGRRPPPQKPKRKQAERIAGPANRHGLRRARIPHRRSTRPGQPEGER